MGFYERKIWGAKSMTETLRDILMNSSDEDLQVLIDYQKSGAKYKDVKDKYTKVSVLIDDIRTNGGNTFANLIRGNGVEYDEIVRDVANKLKVNYHKNAQTDAIEIEIIKKLISDEFEKMSLEQKKEILETIGADNVNAVIAAPAMLAGLLAARLSGFAIYKLAAMAANAVARAVLNRGLAFGANAALMRGMGVALGPVGWVVTGAWFAVDIAGPAYRKTIPSVIQIALLRQKYRQSQLRMCEKCQAPITEGAKYCSECGEPIK